MTAWRCGGIWNSYLVHKLGRGNDDIKGKCPFCRCVMDHDLEIQSWHIYIDCTVLRASRRVSGLKTLPDNLYQRLDLYTESMGIYFLGGNPGGHPKTTQMGAEDLEILLTV
ncbi:hypothetical protein AYI69_g6577 [Smittium culicis]|uniref:Uncharacterized protein n=1 Tax=Smittium culicis TaxID=133412 RepID=A0A1R1XY64_9FUNG|nr:hypothetical protein AYI69_g6577 [Smittium culicis]